MVKRNLYATFQKNIITPPESDNTVTKTCKQGRDLGRNQNEASLNLVLGLPIGQDVARSDVNKQSDDQPSETREWLNSLRNLSETMPTNDKVQTSSCYSVGNNLFPRSKRRLDGSDTVKGDPIFDIGSREKTSCYYVKTSLGNVKGGMLIASVSILSSACYNKLQNKPKLDPISVPLSTANEVKLKTKGICHLSFETDHLTFSFDVIVAEIEESIGILGMDFLRNIMSASKFTKGF